MDIIDALPEQISPKWNSTRRPKRESSLHKERIQRSNLTGKCPTILSNKDGKFLGANEKRKLAKPLTEI